MGGIVLYLITLALESISVAVRFTLVAGVASLLVGREAGIAIGVIAGLAPVVYSLAALAGLPRGHLLTRAAVGGRRLTPAEEAQLHSALAVPRAHGVPIPDRIFAVDREGLNAFVSGRTLYIHRELFTHPGLPAVLAHELGHYNSLDGRLSGAIFGLTLPGGFLITYTLLSVLQWVAYGFFMLLLGLFVMVFLLARLNIWGLLRGLFALSITITRFAIIFAVGGVGTALLGSLWRNYYLQREYAADAYAARLGYRDALIDFFEREVLSDVSIPWYTTPTHPPTTRRIAALQALGQPGLRPTRARPGLHALRPWAIAAVVGTGLLALMLVATLTLGLGASPTPTPPPAPGPTPTLGVPPAYRRPGGASLRDRHPPPPPTYRRPGADAPLGRLSGIPGSPPPPPVETPRWGVSTGFRDRHPRLYQRTDAPVGPGRVADQHGTAHPEVESRALSAAMLRYPCGGARCAAARTQA